VQGLTKKDWRFLVAEQTKSTLMDLISGPVDQTSSPQEKITLFRSLSEVEKTCTRGDSRAAR
jgi:hypothetical protein